MLCHVDSYQSVNGSKHLHLQSQAVKEWTVPRLLDPKDEGATVIQNNGKYLQITLLRCYIPRMLSCSLCYMDA